MALLCSVHHQRVHAGTLVIEGVPGALRFFHADGTAYGGAPEVATAQVCAEALEGLVGLGFAEREARQALAAVRDEAAAGLEQVVRAALEWLRPAG